MQDPNVLISGSGIAGAVFAFWLLRAYPNANITIVERAPSLRLTGASVDIRNSAVDIIKWMGVEGEIRKHSTNEKGVSWINANGKPIATIEATGRTDIQTLTSEFEIFRGALAEIFIAPSRKQVKLIFDETVDTFEQRDDKVIVTFTKSRDVKTYDLLVAADGLNSMIRGMMLNTKPSEQIYDEGVHVAYFTVKQDILEGSKLAKWYNAPLGRVIFIRPDPNPAGRSRGNLVNVTTSSDTAMKAKLNKAISEGNESYMKLMEESFADAGWIAPEVLRGMRESDDFYCSLFGQVRSPNLCSGRVVLLGDAGYATPGIGTSLAIMGGYVLAGELLNHGNDFEMALRGYEKLMLPFVKKSQGNTNGMQWLNPQTKWGIGVRNLILGFVTWVKLDKLAIALAVAFGWTEGKLDMPDYQWKVEKKV